MIVPNFGYWSSASGRWFIRERVYSKRLARIATKLDPWAKKRAPHWWNSIRLFGWTPLALIRRRRFSVAIDVEAL